MIPKNPQITPTIVPTNTCARLCCNSTIRLVITQPDSRIVPHNHQMGLKPKMVE